MIRSAPRPGWPLLALLVFTAFPASLHAETASGLRLHPLSPTFEAAPLLQWDIRLRIENPGPGAVYVDSAFCDIEDLDPGVTGVPARSRAELPFMRKLIEGVGAGDSTLFEYTAPATAEHARLTFMVYGQHMDHSRVQASATVEALPGPTSREFPSQFLTVEGKRVEVIPVPAADTTKASHPGLLLVHGPGSHARRYLRLAQSLAARGYTVLLVSQPGYGLSDGPADFMGAASAKAMVAALDRLRALPGVDPKRIGAWGMSRGATCVMTLAEHRTDLEAVVAQDGTYDLWASYRGSDTPALRDTILAQAGRDSAGWRERSPLLGANQVKASVLVLHAETDTNAPAAQAHALVTALQAHGVAVESKFFPGTAAPRNEAQRLALEFLGRRLAP